MTGNNKNSLSSSIDKSLPTSHPLPPSIHTMSPWILKANILLFTVQNSEINLVKKRITSESLKLMVRVRKRGSG